jgi:hypothetical protein
MPIPSGPSAERPSYPTGAVLLLMQGGKQWPTYSSSHVRKVGTKTTRSLILWWRITRITRSGLHQLMADWERYCCGSGLFLPSAPGNSLHCKANVVESFRKHMVQFENQSLAVMAKDPRAQREWHQELTDESDR